MSTRIAYPGVILIWATTPLAIKWSSEGAGFMFAVTSRMALGMVASWMMLRLFRQTLPRHPAALRVYLIGGLAIYLSMSCVYWASQYIPSGWVSVVFGLSPILTGVLAMLILGESGLTPHRLIGMLMGVLGLALIFGHGEVAGEHFVAGILGVLLSTFFHSLSAVLLKRLSAGVSGLAVTTGGLAIAAPLFALTWYLVDGVIPAAIPARAVAATVYLGVIATTLGFALYYYILSHMEVGRVALITLITPVCALLLGSALNREPLTAGVLAGTACIMAGLCCHEFGRVMTGRWPKRRRV